jgi:two-component system, chemotaxis family, sensor kinase CheA
MFIIMGTMVPKGRGTILIVDDDEDIRSEMRAVFEEDGYTVLEAGDGVEALEILHWSGSDFIRALVLDLWMPRMSGWDFLQYLKNNEAFSRIPVVVASALPVHGDASGIGATMHWLRKPFGSRELLDAVRSCEVERSTRSTH